MAARSASARRRGTVSVRFPRHPADGRPAYWPMTSVVRSRRVRPAGAAARLARIPAGAAGRPTCQCPEAETHRQDGDALRVVEGVPRYPQPLRAGGRRWRRRTARRKHAPCAPVPARQQDAGTPVGLAAPGSCWQVGGTAGSGRISSSSTDKPRYFFFFVPGEIVGLPSHGSEAVLWLPAVGAPVVWVSAVGGYIGTCHDDVAFCRIGFLIERLVFHRYRWPSCPTG